MQKLHFLILILLFSSCLNEKTGLRDESLQILSSDGNYLAKNLVNYDNDYLITGVRNEKSDVSSINFLDVKTWDEGQGYIAVLNNVGEPIITYTDDSVGSIYSSINYDKDTIYVGGTHDNEFMWLKFLKGESSFNDPLEIKWKNEEFSEGVINLIQKVGDRIIVVGRGSLRSGGEKVYLAGFSTDGELLWEKMNDRLSQYILPKEIKEENGKVKALVWEIKEFETKEEVAEYTIDPELGLIESVNFLSVDDYYFTDATWLYNGIVGLAKSEGKEDKLFWMPSSGEAKEIEYDYGGTELGYLIGKENYFIVTSPLEGDSEIKYHNITINGSGDVLSHEEFINSVDSRLIGVDYLPGDDQYLTLTSSLLKFKYVLEFRKN
ncbi:hypothetical protein [Flammeovirga sp. SJP92]|uniref:hypothetical protein n=1 Tax=Flammeovirga sp. SJP92 TaxID=1775430 RepID=UPI0012F8C057|nr:hypothetical protein [Flammeovirga sp. SJP92]